MLAACTTFILPHPSSSSPHTLQATIVRNHELWVNGKLVQSIPKLTRIPLDECGKEIKPRPRVRKGVPDPEKVFEGQGFSELE